MRVPFVAPPDRWRWALMRVAAMSPRELPFRVREQWRRRRDRVATPPKLPGRVLDKPLPVWPFPTSALEDLPADARAALRADADALLDGTFTLLGQRWTAAQRRAWDLDPETGLGWGDGWCFDVDFRADPHRRDPKPCWELNRLQHLQVLAWAHVALAHPGAADAALGDIEDWIAKNPPYRGLGYAAGVEVACRVVSLLLVASTLRADLPDGLRRELWGALHAHGVWLERYPSLYSSANNHRVAELAALVVLGALAPELPGAACWLVEGVDGLRRRARALILADGVGVEQSPTYLAWTLEWFLIARQAARARGIELGDDVDARLLAGAGHLAALCDRSGDCPRIGDDDDSVVIRRTLAPEPRPVAIAGAIASVFGRGELCPRAFVPDVRTALLGGHAPATRYRPRSRSFAAGGCTVLHAEGDGHERHVVFDHGPLGMAPMAAHGHDDALAVWVRSDGHPLLIDAGTWRYGGRPEARVFFRGAAAHNVATIDGRGASEPDGGFSWRRQAHATRVDLDLARGRVAGELRHESGVVHRRDVELDVDRLVIDDRFAGAGARLVELRFLFAPDLDVEAVADGFRLRRNGRPVAHVRPPDDALARWLRQDASAAPGVTSPAYGVLAPAPCLVLSALRPLPLRFTTVLSFL